MILFTIFAKVQTIVGMVMKKGILVLTFIFIAINQTIGQTSSFASTRMHPSYCPDSCMLHLLQIPTYKIEKVGKYYFLFSKEKEIELFKPSQERNNKPIHLSLNSQQHFDIKNLHLPQRKMYNQNKAADIFFGITSLFLDIMFPCPDDIDL